MCVYVLPRPARRAPLLVVDCLLALYLGWAVVPQYALLSTAVGMHPSALYHNLRWSKVSGMSGVAFAKINVCSYCTLLLVAVFPTCRQASR